MNTWFRLLVIFLSNLLVLCMSSCGQPRITESFGQNINQSNTDTSLHNSSQRNRCLADFDNFTYNWFPRDYASLVNKRRITLVGGKTETHETKGGLLYEAVLENVSCVDLNEDGRKEAVVTVKVSFSNRANPTRIFIYGLKNGDLEELWHYDTRTNERDLRKLDLTDKTMVLEEYDNKYENPPNCCPKRFFVSFFSWENGSFRLIDSKIMPYENKYRDFLGFQSLPPRSEK